MRKRVLLFLTVMIIGMGHEKIFAASPSDYEYGYLVEKGWDNSVYTMDSASLTPGQKFRALFSEYKGKSTDPKMMVLERIRSLVEGIDRKTQEMSSLGGHVTPREKEYIKIEIQTVNSLLDKIHTLLEDGKAARSTFSLIRKKTLQNKEGIEDVISELSERKGRISSVIDLALKGKAEADEAERAAQAAIKRRHEVEKRRLEQAEEDRMKALLAEFMKVTTVARQEGDYSKLKDHQALALRLYGSSLVTDEDKRRVDDRLQDVQARAERGSPVVTLESVYGYDNENIRGTAVDEIPVVHRRETYLNAHPHSESDPRYLNVFHSAGDESVY